MKEYVLKDFRLENLFVIIASIVGALLVMITPPMTVPDEGCHFLNAYTVSRGEVFPSVQDGVLGKHFSHDVINFVEKYNSRFAGKFGEKYSFGEYYFDGWAETDKTEFFSSYYTPAINPTGYFISGLGMAVGRLLMSDTLTTPYNLLLFGRFSNLSFYILLFYFSLRLTPIFKKTMFLISLMPMSLFLAASLSYDAVLIPACCLLFAVTLRIYHADEKYRVTFRDKIIVIFIAFCLGAVKQAYMPLLLILFSIPVKKFLGRKDYLITLLLTAASACVGFLWYKLPYGTVAQNITDPNAVYYAEQTSYIVNHVLKIPAIILNSLWMFKNFYGVGFFGKLGQLDTNFPMPVVLLFFVVLLLTVLYDAAIAQRVKSQLRLYSIAGVAMSIGIIFIALYITWTSLPDIAGVGSDFVSGVQGRYFIPLALFGFLALSNRFLKEGSLEKFEMPAHNITVVTALIIGTMTLFTVYTRYW